MNLLVSIAHDSEMLSEKSNQKKLLKIMTIAPNPEDYVGSVKTRSEVVLMWKSIFSYKDGHSHVRKAFPVWNPRFWPLIHRPETSNFQR